MKILVTFFCVLIFGFLVLLATVDLEPFLSPEKSQIGEPAVTNDEKGGNTPVVDKSPDLLRVNTSKEYQSPESEDANNNEPALSKITTHQLIVTDKRGTEKIVTKTQQQTLPQPPGKTPAPKSNLPTE